MKYYVMRSSDGPTIIYRTDGTPDDEYMSRRTAPEWVPDVGDQLMGMLVKGEEGLDWLDPSDVDATVADLVRLGADLGASQT